MSSSKFTLIMLLLLISSENGCAGNFHSNYVYTINVLLQCHYAVKNNLQKEGKSFLQGNITYIQRP